ncbi:DUF3108 domain-containing protein [Methylobacterium sp. NEAU K]|uniref:DUF3108 domain-containing protein n=1 Tax=Methylobacterium sp. NEAU K TaxID=3064946 RepID=UPI0027359295|nr:DUF3108 domain-containing protein [Methylobacterium sp. NEAU K]MDP4005613.1 DUF3108 domain-containing protein [Methylobacterium sp. NEAU K]
MALANRQGCGASVLLTLFFLLTARSADGASRPDAAQRFVAHYSLSFLNVPVGRADLTAEIAADRYVISLDGGLSGLAGWFFQGSGSARSRGRLSPAGTVPGDFRIDSRYGTTPVLVHVAFEAGTVRTAEVRPEAAPKPDRVPLSADDTAKVTDPIGMLAVPVGPGPLAPALCDRRIAVFDGATRADIVLSRGVVVTVAAGPYRGPALECRIRWVPVAGHRAKGPSVRRMAENDDMRVRLAPVPEVGLLLPLTIAVGTGWGTARIEATTWGAPPAVRAASPVRSD